MNITMRKKIVEIVINAANSLNNLLDNKLPIELGEMCCLYGSTGLLDSLSLVSLIVSVEEGIENEFNVSVILASEKAMSQKNSPFSTVKSLADYVESLLNQEI